MIIRLLVMQLVVLVTTFDCTPPPHTLHIQTLIFSMKGPFSRLVASHLYGLDSLLLPKSRYYSVRFYNNGIDTIYIPVNKIAKPFIYPNHEVSISKDGLKGYNISEGFPDYLLSLMPVSPNGTAECFVSCQFPNETEKIEISFPFMKEGVKMSVYQEREVVGAGHLKLIEGSIKISTQ